jgi:uncharacterized protein YjbI with pentapeptide repeats
LWIKRKNYIIAPGEDLTEADLLRANLENANLRGANHQNADLRWANLQKADLRNAKLLVLTIGLGNIVATSPNLAASRCPRAGTPRPGADFISRNVAYTVGVYFVPVFFTPLTI